MDLMLMLELLGRPWISRFTSRVLRVSDIQRQDSLLRDQIALSRRAKKNKSSLSVGVCQNGQPLDLQLKDVMASSIICGSTGSGKTKAAEVLLRELLPLSIAGRCGIGIIDCKGDLVKAAMQGVGDQPRRGTPIHVLNLHARDAVIPYDILKLRPGEAAEELITRRMATFADILGSEAQLSLRMLRMLRSLFALLIEFSLSFASLEWVLESPDLAYSLSAKSKNDRLRNYFSGDFEKERGVTLPALRYRLDYLFSKPGVRLSLSAGECFRFQEAMDEGGLVLINLAGAGQASAVFQSLMLSDLREATFIRQRPELSFLWLLDEAQVLFDRPADKENLATILGMSRSFGVHIVLITQSLGSAFGDSAFYQNLETNFRWLLLLRSGVKDAAIIRPGLRVTGLLKSGVRSGRPVYLTPEQELRYLLQEIPNLPAQEGYFWLRGSGAKAIRIRTHTIESFAPSKQHSQFAETNSSLLASVQARLKSEAERLRTTNSRPVAKKLGLDALLAEIEKDYAAPNLSKRK